MTGQWPQMYTQFARVTTASLPTVSDWSADSQPIPSHRSKLDQPVCVHEGRVGVPRREVADAEVEEHRGGDQSRFAAEPFEARYGLVPVNRAGSSVRSDPFHAISTTSTIESRARLPGASGNSRTPAAARPLANPSEWGSYSPRRVPIPRLMRRNALTFGLLAALLLPGSARRRS